MASLSVPPEPASAPGGTSSDGHSGAGGHAGGGDTSTGDTGHLGGHSSGGGDDPGNRSGSGAPVEGVDYGFSPTNAFEILKNPADEIARLREAGVPGQVLEGYDPLAGRTLDQFSEEFTFVDADGNLKWDWEGQAPNNGFAADPAITDRIPKDLMLDRLGSEYGAFMAEEGAPLSSRGMPPGVASDYHGYAGTDVPVPDGKPWEVRYGPLKDAFGQPGGADQWVVVDIANPEGAIPVRVKELLRHGMVRRVFLVGKV